MMSTVDLRLSILARADEGSKESGLTACGIGGEEKCLTAASMVPPWEIGRDSRVRLTELREGIIVSGIEWQHIREAHGDFL